MSSACLESLMPMHSATASALMTSLLAAPARVGSCWISEGEFPPRLTVPAMFDYFTYETPLLVYVLYLPSRVMNDLLLWEPGVTVMVAAKDLSH
ncbi:protein NUCLEAR FUSION DEFECTIVE 6, chloroplastic/mitochondrial-like [Hordeum vulgare]|nr:protein NUCLEAR FUSION DEFECTIVE 6, chloroplastic/mitochondrial-like [Hordeum vulgare]